MSSGRSNTTNTDKPVVVGKYNQTRQRWLRAKIIKFDHDRHIKKGDPSRAQESRPRGGEELKRKPRNRKQALRKERKKKDKRKIRKRRKEKTESWIGRHVLIG